MIQVIDANEGILKVGPQTARGEKPTPLLRWRQDLACNMKILQQGFEVTWYENGEEIGQTIEWRDVPFEGGESYGA